MAVINVLDAASVDKIAAGEVVERPVSVVKELVENAIDAGATRVTVEIKDGGESLIRVTDDGSGIEKSELSKVFYRHATSKIKEAEDLKEVMTLGFRGEALSSIGAVAKVELITKTKDELVGSRLQIEGGTEKDPEAVGAPDGTTVVVRDIFYNTPARLKFLKSATTEGNYIYEYMQHLALSAPKVAFQFVSNGQTRFFTSGNGDIKEIIYRIWGKDVSAHVLFYEASMDGVTIRGYLGRPILARANRSFETLFVNGRYIKSALLSSAIEEGYRTLLMQHKYPFVVLHFAIDPTRLDVNVHPTKLDIRISEPGELLKLLAGTIADTLTGKSLIQPVDDRKMLTAEEKKEIKQEEKAAEKELTKVLPQPFEKENITRVFEEKTLYDASQGTAKNVITGQETGIGKVLGLVGKGSSKQTPGGNIIKQRDMVIVQKPTQMELFEETDIRNMNIENLQIIGQVFDTYWIVSMGDKIYYVDQHAAHEKVMYERLMAHYRKKEIYSQSIDPPIAVDLTPKEYEVLDENRSSFAALGFETEDFGDGSIAIRSVPMDLYGCSEKELFLSALDALMEGPVRGGADSDAVLFKIASMSCKAAVKGNMKLSFDEAKALFQEMFACENPYHCPHGRPTMISISKQDMEKRFHR
ncbi:MAG: DNA mismatch repair endonuclease MutL [Lachnospiraceae bacterium]|nr:DNA mismatch repair endonuclease MutL [Lachnospiraceae bacterium]